MIFGIKCNGVSITVSKIQIEDDQSKYDYICNVLLRDFWNGNGTYNVSILNKDRIPGMPVGKWRIKTSKIDFDWGNSKATLIMEDENGVETSDITAGVQKGSASGFDVSSLTETIFTKAQEIIIAFPNAETCNAILELKKSEDNLNISYLTRRYKEALNESNESYIYFIEYASNILVKHLAIVKKAMTLLEQANDPKSKQLLKNITSDCRKLLDSLIS